MSNIAARCREIAAIDSVILNSDRWTQWTRQELFGTIMHGIAKIKVFSSWLRRGWVVRYQTEDKTHVPSR